MKAFAYLLSLALALPALVWALGILLLRHLIATHNLLRLFWELMVMLYHSIWVAPLLLIGLLIWLGAGFFPAGRLVGALLLIGLLLGAVVVTLWNIGPPRNLGEAVFWLPTLVSLALSAWLTWSSPVWPAGLRHLLPGN